MEIELAQSWPSFSTELLLSYASAPKKLTAQSSFISLLQLIRKLDLFRPIMPTTLPLNTSKSPLEWTLCSQPPEWKIFMRKLNTTILVSTSKPMVTELLFLTNNTSINWKPFLKTNSFYWKPLLFLKSLKSKKN